MKDKVIYEKYLSSRKDSFGRGHLRYENAEISVSSLLHYVAEKLPMFMSVVNAINEKAKTTKESFEKGCITKQVFQSTYHPFTMNDFGNAFELSFEKIDYVEGELIGNILAQRNGSYYQIVEHKLTDFGNGIMSKVESVQKREEAHRNAILASL